MWRSELEWDPSIKEKKILIVNFVSTWSDLLLVFLMKKTKKNLEISPSITLSGPMMNSVSMKKATLCNWLLNSEPIPISTQTNNKYLKKSVCKFCQMLGKVIIAAFLLMVRPEQANRILWLAMEPIKYWIFNSGYCANFLRVDFQSNRRK